MYWGKRGRPRNTTAGVPVAEGGRRPAGHDRRQWRRRVGGYVFEAGSQEEPWVVSQRWPTDVAEALGRAAATPAEREAEERAAGTGAPLPWLSMPAAELFGSWAVAHAAAHATGRSPRAVVA
eukprot:6188980-Pleurochrysis_carterae.AAC.1